MTNKSYDVIIIGGGVVGCAIARELSKYELRIALLEKAADICAGHHLCCFKIPSCYIINFPGSLVRFALFILIYREYILLL